LLLLLLCKITWLSNVHGRDFFTKGFMRGERRDKTEGGEEEGGKRERD